MTKDLADAMCPEHCRDSHRRIEEDVRDHVTRIDKEDGDQWKAIQVVRDSVYRRPSWYTMAIIATLSSVTSYLYAKLDSERGLDSRVSIQMVKVEARLDAIERQLAVIVAAGTQAKTHP